MASKRSIIAAAGMFLVTALAFQGCGKQTEGQRCEVDDDCDTNLKCTNVGSSDKICCPDRANATTSECRNGVTTVTDTGTAEAAADTGTAAETATDTGTAAETATDTGSADTTPATTDAADAD